MTVQLSYNKAKLSKNETTVCTVTIATDKPAESAVIEIIPSVEKYPEMVIIPDSATPTASGGLQANAEMGENGIFTITLPSTGSQTEFSVSFDAASAGFTDNNTSAAMVSVYRGGNVYEAYSQTYVSGKSPMSIGIAAALLTAAAAVTFYRIFLHSR
ncbi:MAG: hypothetical protein Q4G33_04995 [bacterium]|nr:hypothetical protein [bacterium]